MAGRQVSTAQTLPIWATCLKLGSHCLPPVLSWCVTRTGCVLAPRRQVESVFPCWDREEAWDAAQSCHFSGSCSPPAQLRGRGFPAGAAAVRSPHTAGHREGPLVPWPCSAAARSAARRRQRAGEASGRGRARRGTGGRLPPRTPRQNWELSPFNVGLTTKVTLGKHAAKNVQGISRGTGGLPPQNEHFRVSRKKMNR